MIERALLIGGPQDGRTVQVSTSTSTLVYPDLPLQVGLLWSLDGNTMDISLACYRRRGYIEPHLAIFVADGVTDDMLATALAKQPFLDWLNEWATDMMNRSHRDITH